MRWAPTLFVLGLVAMATATKIRDEVFWTKFEAMSRAALKQGAFNFYRPPVELPQILTKPEALSSVTKCPDGFTGPDCTNPICYNNSQPHVLEHDGTANYGDAVAWDFSRFCTESNIAIPIDSTIDTINVIIGTIDSGIPSVTLTSPMGHIVEACGTDFSVPSRIHYQFCNIQNTHKAGVYALSISSTSDSPCGWAVLAPSNLTIDGGFVQDQRDDNLQQFLPFPNCAIYKNPVEREPSYFAFRMKEDTFPTQVTSIEIFPLIDTNEVTFDNHPRYGCNFPHITVKPLLCMHDNYYNLRISGIDAIGTMWQRMYPFECEPELYTGTMPTFNPPTLTPATQCDNHGILTSNGTCYCGEFFEGPKCQWKVCFNDGVLNPNMDCSCTFGFSGDHCENVHCPQMAHDNYNLEHRALGFVVRVSTSMQAQIDQIVSAAINITAYYNVYHNEYFEAYVLTVVQNGDVAFTHEYDNCQSFLDALKALTHPPTDTVCEDVLLSGVLAMVTTATYRKYPLSPVFVFSDGVSSDDDTTKGVLQEQFGQFKGPIYFIASDSANGMCNVDVTSPNYKDMRNFARLSLGLVIKTDLATMGQATYEIATETLYHTANVMSNDLDDCRKAPLYQTFFVDDTMERLFIEATGIQLSPLITLPNRTVIKPDVVYKNGNYYMWELPREAARTGGYLLNMNTLTSGQTTCQYRVRAHAHSALLYSYADNLLVDSSSREAIYGHETHPVAFAYGIPVADPLDMTAELTMWYNDPQSQERKILFASSGIIRDQCEYNLFFGSFSCQYKNLPFYITAYITDALGATVQRTGTGYCLAKTPNPPDNQCLNGGVYLNGTCICASHYYGDKCDQINCENQGTAVFGTCQCPPGFDGDFCEITKCMMYNEDVVYVNIFRSLSFLMHDTLSTRSMFRTTQQESSRVVNDIVHQHALWIVNYQMYTFNDTGYTMLVNSNDPDKFVDGFNTAYNNNLNGTGVSCADLDLWPTLLSSLKEKGNYPFGLFYIFIKGTVKSDPDTYHQILQYVEMMQMQINVVQMSLSPCGLDASSDGLMDLVQLSGGQYIVASAQNAGSAMRTVPSQYSSAYVYERTETDCSDMTFFLPVDSQTQTVGIYIQGDLTSDPVYISPNGEDYSVLNMISDLGSGSRYDYVSKPCDPGWNFYDGHCWQFGFSQMSWYNAQTQCHSAGASLGTIYNQNDQTYLDSQSPDADYWTGLNDLKNLGVWQWDVASRNQTLDLTTTGYTNWAQGQPVTDEQKRCVADVHKNGPPGWTALNCDDKKYYVCVKHVYDPDFNPGDMSKNHLPRGIWQINVKADGACSISMHSQSTLLVHATYTTDIHNDFGAEEPIAGSENNRLIARVTGLDIGTKYSLEYAHFYYENMSIVDAETMSYRDGCFYSYISTPFTCPGPVFNALLTGVDDYGYLYQRILPVACFSGVKDGDCMNGGVYYQGACICPPTYIGPTCGLPYCQNGGYPAANLIDCNCPGNFAGQFCQYPKCERNMNKTPDVSVDGKTFVLALDGAFNGLMAKALQNIGATLTDVLNDAQNGNPGWFTSYVAVLFRDRASVNASVPSLSTTIVSNSVQDFVDAVVAETVKYPYVAQQPKREILAALTQALSDPSIKPRSVAFVLTSGNTEDTYDYSEAINALANTHTSVSMLILGDTTAPGNDSYESPAVGDLFETAHVSGGSFYQLPSADSLAMNWKLILSTMHHSYDIVSHHVHDCSNYQDYIQLGANGSNIVVDMFAVTTTPTVRVRDQNGDEKRLIPLVSTQTNLLDSVSQAGQNPGIWEVDLDPDATNTGSCLYNIRAQSNVDVYLAFTQDTAADGGYHDGGGVLFPLAGFEGNAVLAATNDGTITYAQLYDAEEVALFWASPMIERRGCGYQFISQSIFVCQRASFTLALSGLDHAGHPFRRIFPIHCQGFVPPPYTGAPPTGSPRTLPPITVPHLPTTKRQTISPAVKTTPYPTCDPSVPKVDLIIAFDGSAGMHYDVYQQTLAQFREFVHHITIGPDNVRIIMGTYDAWQHFEGTDFDNITDVLSYVLRLSELQTTGYTGMTGNNIDDVLQYIMYGAEIQSPLRKDARQVFVHISTLGWDKGNTDSNGVEQGYADPGHDIAIMKETNFEFVPIAFGYNANPTQLKVFSSKCIQYADSVADVKQAVNFLEFVLCHPTPYC